MDLEEQIKAKGDVEIIIDYVNGKKDTLLIKNAILKRSKEASVKGLVNQIGGEWSFYIEKMIFGTNGRSMGVPKVVEDSRNGLFGPTLLSKNISAIVNPNISTQAIFTTVVTSSEGNGNTIDELALQMKNGDLYSMTTFGGISKTSSMQITFNWRLSFV
jgi:hypothetical protein